VGRDDQNEFELVMLLLASVVTDLILAMCIGQPNMLLFHISFIANQNCGILHIAVLNA